jgi:hypothetical protein
MSPPHTTRPQPDSGSRDDAWRPPPVDVPLDDNASPRRRGAEVAPAPRAATHGHTIRRTIVVLAVGAIGGATMALGVAHPTPSTAPTSTTARPVSTAAQLRDEPAAARRPSGDTVTDVIAGLDAITEAQIARVTSTDGPLQVAAIQFLRRQHDDLRALILTYHDGWPPDPVS